MASQPPPSEPLARLSRRPLARFPGWRAALGPGIVWMALAQGSGELIWWPYTVAKYGLTFLFLLIPACLLQYPLNIEIGQWRRYLSADAMVGIGGNLATTLMTCLLAWALLFPKGLLPRDYELAVVQARFFEVSWGPIGRVLFLVVAAAFLTDTWLATADGVSRMQADIVQTLYPASRRLELRQLYFLFLGLLTVVTCGTMLLDAPGPLILLSAVIGFAGTVIFPAAHYVLNYRRHAPALPAWARPRPIERWLLGLSFAAYLTLAAAYLWQEFRWGQLPPPLDEARPAGV